MTVIGERIISIEDRARRSGIEILNWDRVGLNLFCTRCGRTFGASFQGGDLSRPERGWWKCPEGCNASSRDPLLPPVEYEAVKPSSLFTDVIKD